MKITRFEYKEIGYYKQLAAKVSDAQYDAYVQEYLSDPPFKIGDFVEVPVGEMGSSIYKVTQVKRE